MGILVISLALAVLSRVGMWEKRERVKRESRNLGEESPAPSASTRPASLYSRKAGRATPSDCRHIT